MKYLSKEDRGIGFKAIIGLWEKDLISLETLKKEIQEYLDDPWINPKKQNAMDKLSSSIDSIRKKF